MGYTVTMNSNINEIHEIANALSKLEPQDGFKFLSEILTPSEIETLSKRWRILKMLEQGISQRDIAKQLNVSLCKVTRGAKILKSPNSISSNLIKE